MTMKITDFQVNFQRKLNKKAQVTLFILVGIILLITTIGVVYISGYKIEKEFKKEAAPVIEDIPKEASPVGIFVTKCLEQTAIDGLEILGAQGGYIETEALAPNPMLPTEGDSVKFSSAIIPYWHYLESSNRKTEYKFSSKAPSRDRDMMSKHDMSIPAQLDRYINTHLKTCLNNFNQLKAQGFTISAEIPEAETYIRESDILIKLKYPLHIRKSAEIIGLEDFYSIIPLDFKRLYQTAEMLAKMHEQFNYTETTTMNLISILSMVDKDKLPPISATSDARVFWLKTNVANSAREMLTTHLPKIQIKGTENYKEISTGDAQNDEIHKIFNIDIINYDYSNYEINHIYNRFPIYFDIANVRGELIGPSTFSQNFMGISYSQNNYAAKYDISYPVIVEIKDTSALEQKGYSFFFALESNIRNNRPIRPASSIVRLDTSGDTLLCNPYFMVTDDITVKAQKDSEVYFQCGTIVSCYIGKTGSNNELTAKFPYCPRGGILKVKSKDTIGMSMLFDTTYDKKATAEFALEPIYSLNAEIKIIDKNGNKRALLPEETASLTITRIKENPLENDFNDQMLLLKKDESQEIQLANGKYQIEGQLMYGKAFDVTTSWKEPGLFGSKPRTAVNSIPSGMVIGGVAFEITLDGLNGKNKITFYLKTPYDVPTTTDQLGEILNEMEKYSKESELKPLIE